MHNVIVIADSSCLIALTNIRALWILEKAYEKIYITKIVAEEYDLPIPDFIEIKEVVNTNLQRVLISVLDPGEASSIALAMENPNSMLILDDLKGRKEAKKLNLKYTGTLGILVKAKQYNYIHDVGAYLKELKQSGFRISDRLIELAIKESER